ncbi:MAG: hypothetical protein RIC16_12375 [Rhodospirillales bacterium]
MNTHVIENDFASIVLRAFCRLSLTLKDTLEQREERRIRRSAERQLQQLDPRLLRDIGYDRIRQTVGGHA